MDKKVAIIGGKSVGLNAAIEVALAKDIQEIKDLRKEIESFTITNPYANIPKLTPIVKGQFKKKRKHNNRKKKRRK